MSFVKEKMLKGAPLVSVILTVFNGERFLAEAVDSILAQSFREIELIMIDDGSTDGSGGYWIPIRRSIPG